MAGTLKTSQFNSATVANPTDEVPLLQGGQLKRVQVKVLTGNPDVGWQASGESWVYASWDATRRQATFTVPSDATVKYMPRMRVRISQATGGTKYGIITYVTATVLHVHFPSGVTVNNEAVLTSFYSPLAAPVGFPNDPTLWELKATVTTQISQAAANGTWYNINGVNVPLGAGVWRVRAKMMQLFTSNTAQNFLQSSGAISTSASTPNDLEAVFRGTNFNGVTSTENDSTFMPEQNISLTSNGAAYYISQGAGSGTLTLYLQGTAGVHTSWIKAVTAYL